MTPPETNLRLRNTYRLVPSRYPSAGILDAISSPEDLDAVIELESWTNDRVSAEFGVLQRIPREEWVTGRPMSTVVMAAFCHPRPGGGRFSGPDRGAWYASLTRETAHAEVIYHRTAELAEIGVFETYVHERAYLADFTGRFHDIRTKAAAFRPFYSPVDYTESQKFAREFLEIGSNGVIYRSVRHDGGYCVACFRPRLVVNVRQGDHFEYRWTGGPVPVVRKLTGR